MRISHDCYTWSIYYRISSFLIIYFPRQWWHLNSWEGLAGELWKNKSKRKVKIVTVTKIMSSPFLISINLLEKLVSAARRRLSIRSIALGFSYERVTKVLHLCLSRLNSFLSFILSHPTHITAVRAFLCVVISGLQCRHTARKVCLSSSSAASVP